MLFTHWDIICWHPTSVVHFRTLIPVVCPLGDQAYSKARYKIFKKIGTLLFFHWHFYPSFDPNLILFFSLLPFPLYHFFFQVDLFLSPTCATQPWPCAFKLTKFTEFTHFFLKNKRPCINIILIENKNFKRSNLFSWAGCVFHI